MKVELVEYIDEASLRRAKLVLESGGVIVLPTDTNYNIVCGAHSAIGADKIFKIKGRMKHKPLSLFFSKPNEWKKYGYSKNNDNVDKVVQYFWPGPLNIILNKTTSVPDHIINGGDTVALGCISNPIWQKVVSYYGQPIVLTSANRSGESSNTLVTKEIAMAHVGKEVDMFFLDNDQKNTTTSSTIIDFTEMEFSIVRTGDIKENEIQRVIYGQ